MTTKKQRVEAATERQAIYDRSGYLHAAIGFAQSAGITDPAGVITIAKTFEAYVAPNGQPLEEPFEDF
jgi:hypothetical protein